MMMMMICNLQANNKELHTRMTAHKVPTYPQHHQNILSCNATVVAVTISSSHIENHHRIFGSKWKCVTNLRRDATWHHRRCIVIHTRAVSGYIMQIPIRFMILLGRRLLRRLPCLKIKKKGKKRNHQTSEHAFYICTTRVHTFY